MVDAYLSVQLKRGKLRKPTWLGWGTRCRTATLTRQLFLAWGRNFNDEDIKVWLDNLPTSWLKDAKSIQRINYPAWSIYLLLLSLFN